MRDVQQESLLDILFAATKQVVRDYSPTLKVRKGYDVVHCQVNEDYHTFSLFVNENNEYTCYHVIREYNGDLTHEHTFVFEGQEDKVVDLMDFLYFNLIYVYTNSEE